MKDKRHIAKNNFLVLLLTITMSSTNGMDLKNAVQTNKLDKVSVWLAKNKQTKLSKNYVKELRKLVEQNIQKKESTVQSKLDPISKTICGFLFLTFGIGFRYASFANRCEWDTNQYVLVDTQSVCFLGIGTMLTYQGLTNSSKQQEYKDACTIKQKLITHKII